MQKCKLVFISERERLLSHKEKMLNELIYGNLSLDEVKNMYHKEYIAKEQINDGQAKDAQPE